MKAQILELLSSPGPVAAAVVAFALLSVWCFTQRRVTRTLAVLGIYLGLLDGYLKLKTGSPYITLARDVLLIAIAAGALLRSRNSGSLQLPPLSVLVFGFVAVVIAEVANPNGREVVGGLAGVRQHLEFVPLFFLGFAFLRTEARLEKLMLILVVCAAVGGVVSYVQSTLTPDQLANWGPGYRERVIGTGSFSGAGRVAFDDDGNQFVRPFGLGSDAGAGATAAALALPALIALFMGMRGNVRLAMLPLFVGIGLAVATSGSRAAVVTVFVSVAAFGLIAAATRNAFRVTGGLIVASTLVFLIFAQLGPGNSAAQRSRSVTPTTLLSSYSGERGGSLARLGTYATRYPLGIGVGVVGPASKFRSRGLGQPEALNSETQWNFLILETGLVGLAIFLALNLRLMFLALTRIRTIQTTRMRLIQAALSAPLFGLVTLGFAGPTTVSVPGAPYFWLVTGILSYWLITAQAGRPATERRDDHRLPDSPGHVGDRDLRAVAIPLARR